ncbi:Uncharacterized protein PCOAH_00027430 [Plasmodium coatneyi]|uniref:CID domain-containing protein n=1 Tax=Plasmodium coatneyi TaxID=208452 RepID=A0A1B1DZ48_9APIC|nr:Uncharacterized protein PCOAH_00027430 [Plasmodium coatneyi]ANQ08010.1 Uncharacterized protein PCOAH_00027430 [Plasmodium coatneyi]
MKYEKKNWNNDKGKKRSEKFPNDGSYGRGRGRRYGKHDEGGGEGRFNNMLYPHEMRRDEPMHRDMRQGDEFSSEMPTYTSASSNFKRSNNNYDVKNETLDQWGHVNSQYMAPPYKKGAMNQKANVRGGRKNNHSRYRNNYVGYDGERGSKFSAYESGTHNVNDNIQENGPPNEDNFDYAGDFYNSDEYYAEDGHHRGDHYGDGDNYHGDRDDYYDNRDDQHRPYNDSYNRNYKHGSSNHPYSKDGSMRRSRKNNHAFEDSPDDNYADSYDEKYGTNFGDHSSNPRGDSRKANINEELSNLHRNLHNLLFSPAKAEGENPPSETNTTSKSKDCNESVLNQLSILRNIPFNVKQSDGEGDKDDVPTKDQVDAGVSDQRSLSPEQKKSSQSSKTAMILDDLKKCLYGSNSKELQTDRGYQSNSYLANDDNHFNVTSGKGYKTVGEGEIRRRNSSNSSGMQNIPFSPQGNAEQMKKGKEEDDITSRRYRNDANYYNTDDVDVESSISSDDHVVMDVYKNEVHEDHMITSSGNIFPKGQIAESLRVLNTLQVDIERVCCYIKHFIDPPEQLFQVMTDVFVDKSVSVNSKIAIFYVYNHLIQELRNNLKNDLIKYYSIAERGLQIFVVPVLRCVLHEQVNVEMVNKFYRCVAIWNERNVYSKIVCEQLKLLQKNPQKKIDFTVKNVASQAHSLLSNELSKFVPINFILKMPSVNNENRKALQDKTLSALFQNISKDTLKGYNEADVEEASKMSDKVMRMYGQELILLNSQILELSSLICDNNDHLVKLQNALENLRD